METANTISSVGSLIGDPTRAIILASLLDGRAWTAGELAVTAGVTPQTISSHLSMLVESGLLHRASQGRHRYFRLANPEVANMLESLTVMATWHLQKTKRPTRAIPNRVPTELRKARVCYDHIAGTLGVVISDALISRQLLSYGDTDYVVTDRGVEFFSDLDIDCDELQKKKRKFAHQCLDWSERRYHIAGALGAEIFSLFLRKKWLRKTDVKRAIQLTPSGSKALRSLLDIRPG